MRKRPQQQRAKIIVENILEGAQKCISDFGVLQLTTPKIAEKSGVSVGSIYQYFENKDQIVAELLLRKSEGLGQALKQLVLLQQQTSIQDIITLSIAFGFESLKSDQGFFIEILKKSFKGAPCRRSSHSTVTGTTPPRSKSSTTC